MRLSVLVLVLPLVACANRGEIQLSAYGGYATSHDSDIRLQQPGTDVTLHDISWDDKSFEDPQYFGLRGTYWFPDEMKNWGIALDFTHPKVIAFGGQTTHVTGVSDGMPVDETVPMRNHLQHVEFSHGHNLLMLNAVHRWFPKGERDKTFAGRLQPYVGAGAGIAIPHVEARVDGVLTSSFQFGGPAVQVLAGVNYDLGNIWSLFLEYKLSYADLKVDIEPVGTIETDIWTHHFILGVSVRF